MLTGLDLGSSQTKVALPSQTLTFPSNLIPGDWRSPVQYKNRFWELSSQFPPNIIEAAILGIICLAQATGTASLQVATNLPFPDKTIWQEALNGDHTVTINGTAHTISIKVLTSIPNGYGGFLDYVLDDQGQKIPDRIKPTTILDCGHNELNVIQTNEAGKILSQSSLSWGHIYERVRVNIKATTGIEVGHNQIKEGLRNGWVGPNLKVAFTQAVLAEQLLITKNLTLLPQVLIHGGHGEQIAQIIPNPILLPSTANAKGLYKLAQRATAQKLP